MRGKAAPKKNRKTKIARFTNGRSTDSLSVMLSTQQMAALNASNCEVAFDNLTLQLYATDASPYQIIPQAVAFPKTVKQAAHIIQAALVAGVSVIPRGAGTGLSGGAVGEVG